MECDLLHLAFERARAKRQGGSGGGEGGGGTSLPTLTNPAAAGDVAASKDFINGYGLRRVGTLAERSGESDITFTMPANNTTPKVTVKSGIYRSSGETFSLDIPTEDVSITPDGTKIDRTHSAGKLIRKVTVQGDSKLTAGNIRKGVTIYGKTGSYEGDDLSDIIGDDSGSSNREKIEAVIETANSVIAEDAETLSEAVGELVDGYHRGDPPVLGQKVVTENNREYRASDDGLDGYSSVTTNIPEPDLSDILGDDSAKTNREKIESAIGSANSVTGEADETLTNAIGSLSEGYVSPGTIGEASGATSQEKVEYLIGVANEAIGGTGVTTLADAVDTLADGYGQGGSGGGSTWSEITISQDCSTFGNCVNVIKSAGYTSGLVFAVYDGTPVPERNKNHFKFTVIPDIDSPYTYNYAAKYSEDEGNTFTYGKLANGTNCYLDAGETIKVIRITV